MSERSEWPFWTTTESSGAYVTSTNWYRPCDLMTNVTISLWLKPNPSKTYWKKLVMFASSKEWMRLVLLWKIVINTGKKHQKTKLLRKIEIVPLKNKSQNEFLRPGWWVCSQFLEMRHNICAETLANRSRSHFGLSFFSFFFLFLKTKG